MIRIVNISTCIPARGAISLFALFALFLPSANVQAQTLVSDRAVTITAQVGGGGTTTVVSSGKVIGGSSITSPTIVTFSGYAYPASEVVVLKDGAIARTVFADSRGSFSVSLENLPPGTYLFGLYVLDAVGTHSAFTSFPITIARNVTVTVADLFLSPTIAIDKTRLRRAENLTVSGYASPLALVTIRAYDSAGGSYAFTARAATTGAYRLIIPAATFAYGAYTIRSIAEDGASRSLSNATDPLRFIIADVAPIQDTDRSITPACGNVRADLTCDGRVNLVDFSVLKAWYKKTEFPKILDLDGDGALTLTDFSILAYNWTG